MDTPQHQGAAVVGTAQARAFAEAARVACETAAGGRVDHRDGGDKEIWVFQTSKGVYVMTREGIPKPEVRYSI